MKMYPAWAIIILAIIFLMPFATQAQADKTDKTNITNGPSGLPIPRFVSLASDKVYLRTGPGKRYPIKKIYQAKRYPLEVTAEYDHWRKLRDRDGTTGWVHLSLLTGYRSFLALGDHNGGDLLHVYNNPDTNSNIILKLEAGVWGSLNQCRQTMCEISIQDFDGWVKKSDIWGVYNQEVFD